MAKKKVQSVPEIEYFIDNKPSSQLEIIENNPDANIWKKYLEENRLRPKNSAERYLNEKLGDYLTTKEINKLIGTDAKTLGKWRNKGHLKAEQLKGRWYYSVASLIEALKSAG